MFFQTPGRGSNYGVEKSYGRGCLANYWSGGEEERDAIDTVPGPRERKKNKNIGTFL